MNFDLLDQEIEDCNNSSLKGPKEAKRYPFPLIQLSKLHAGKYRIHVLPAHDTKNPQGLFPYSVHEVKTDSLDEKKVYRVLHAKSFFNKNDPKAYNGIQNLLTAAKMAVVDGEPLYKVLPEEIRQIFDDLEAKHKWWVPVLISAVVSDVKRDGTPCHPKYPEYKPNTNPNGKMMDAILELDRSKTHTNDFYQLMKANSNFTDYANGVDFQLYKCEKIVEYSVLGNRPVSAIDEDFVRKNYPDLFQMAKRFAFKEPRDIIKAVMGAWWWQDIADLGFALEQPKSRVAGIKVSGVSVAAPVTPQKLVDELNANAPASPESTLAGDDGDADDSCPF